jgi:hypothetical protein
VGGSGSGGWAYGVGTGWGEIQTYFDLGAGGWTLLGELRHIVLSADETQLTFEYWFVGGSDSPYGDQVLQTPSRSLSRQPRTLAEQPPTPSRLGCSIERGFLSELGGGSAGCGADPWRRCFPAGLRPRRRTRTYPGAGKRSRIPLACGMATVPGLG